MAAQKLIILRGPSASGKSTVASEIVKASKRKIALIGEDNLRRTILQRHDDDRSVQIGLLDAMLPILFGKGFDVLLEGILSNKRYKDYLMQVMHDLEGESYLFHFNVTFDETWRRHQTKPISDEYGQTELKAWFDAGSAYDLADEYEIPEPYTISQTVNRVMKVAGL